MDTGTVLQIIEMLDNRIKNDKHRYCELELFMISTDEPACCIREAKREHKVRVKTLQDFKDHLQEYIETQVSQAENALEGGE